MRIQGQCAKASAIYVPEPWKQIGRCFDAGLRTEFAQLELHQSSTFGLESVAVNDPALSSSWYLLQKWDWDRQSHINLLEAGACYKLLRQGASVPSSTPTWPGAPCQKSSLAAFMTVGLRSLCLCLDLDLLTSTASNCSTFCM